MFIKIDNIHFEISEYSIDVTENEKKISFTILTTDESVFNATQELLQNKPLIIETELGIFNIHRVELNTELIKTTKTSGIKSYEIDVIAIC